MRNTFALSDPIWCSIFVSERYVAWSTLQKRCKFSGWCLWSSATGPKIEKSSALCPQLLHLPCVGCNNSTIIATTTVTRVVVPFILTAFFSIRQQECATTWATCAPPYSWCTKSWPVLPMPKTSLKQRESATTPTTMALAAEVGPAIATMDWASGSPKRGTNGMRCVFFFIRFSLQNNTISNQIAMMF